MHVKLIQVENSLVHSRWHWHIPPDSTVEIAMTMSVSKCGWYDGDGVGVCVVVGVTLGVEVNDLTGQYHHEDHTINTLPIMIVTLSHWHALSQQLEVDVQAYVDTEMVGVIEFDGVTEGDGDVDGLQLLISCQPATVFKLTQSYYDSDRSAHAEPKSLTVTLLSYYWYTPRRSAITSSGASNCGW